MEFVFRLTKIGGKLEAFVFEYDFSNGKIFEHLKVVAELIMISETLSNK